MLKQGKTYNQISYEIRCSNREIKIERDKLISANDAIPRIRKLVKDSKDDGRFQRNEFKTDSKALDILHRACRTRLISNSESNYLLSYLVKLVANQR